MKIKEGRRYNIRKKQEHEKQQYTLQDFSAEVTGLDTEDDKYFPSAHIKNTRILKRIKEFIDQPDLKIDNRTKPMLVKVVGKIYYSDYGVDNLTKMINNKLMIEHPDDNGGEDEIWTKLSFIETIADIPTKAPRLFEKESQEFKDIVDEILSEVTHDMTFLSAVVIDQDKKILLAKEYLKDIKDEANSGFHQNWRDEIRQINEQWNRKFDEDNPRKKDNAKE